MSMDEREFRELMDACRAGSEDLHLAELEGLTRLVEQDARVRTTLARSQRVDTEIRTAMQRVAVPDGLAGRILDRIAAEGSPLALPAAEHSAAVSLPASRGGDREMRRRVRRPAWMAASVALASALVLAVILVRYYGPPKSDLITERSLSEDARRWAATLAPTRWKKLTVPDQRVSTQSSRAKAGPALADRIDARSLRPARLLRSVTGGHGTNPAVCAGHQTAHRELACSALRTGVGHAGVVRRRLGR